jgi:lipopolysaccharide biosynthesis glycosyltransferase
MVTGTDAVLGTREAAGSEVALVLAGDDGYGEALAVAMSSALVNLSPALKPEIYVLDNGLSGSARDRLLRVVNSARAGDQLRWIQILDERFAHLSSSTRFTPSIYSRLLIPELLPERVRRAVYLDADVLVRADLSPLFTTELSGAAVGAVRDFLPRATLFFNSGVLVMDVARWRSEGLADRALRYAAESGKLDQDALNEVVPNWHELGYKWNVQHGNLFLTERPAGTAFTEQIYEERWRLYRDAAVLHFVGGPAKPWFPWCTTPGTSAWVRSLMASGWYTRRERLVWLLRWGRKRARFWLGSARARWWTRHSIPSN